MNPSFWNNKSVFITGHTGFKGGWLTHWLSQMGANIYGYALAPLTETNFFVETKLQRKMTSSVIGDIRDLANLTKAIKQAKPNIIFHMAAQPLVRESYKSPVETFNTNVLGTVNLFEAARVSKCVKAIVNVTTDKCYENKEWSWPYREIDRLGGHDPYSSSKACAELVTSSYRRSFLSELGIHVASVRAGNVIGGGDWSTDRLLPDFFRAIDSGETLKVRYPKAIRPWQHVLEPLSGYLTLAEKLYIYGSPFGEAWNFGPDDDDTKSVGWIMDRLCSINPKSKWEAQTEIQPHEAGLLKLDSTKSKTLLGWKTGWNIETALNQTVAWHQAWYNNQEMDSFTNNQIKNYFTLDRKKSSL